jgi:hypothetical protein
MDMMRWGIQSCADGRFHSCVAASLCMAIGPLPLCLFCPLQPNAGVCPDLCRMPECCGSNAGVLGLYAASTGNQISSRLLSARSANALLELPRAEGEITAGGCWCAASCW